MLLLRHPTDAAIRAFLAAQASLDFTYAEVGATAKSPPANYVVDRIRIQLGAGQAAFDRAKSALKKWRQFDLGWLTATPDDAPIHPGTTVAVLAHVCGLWSLNAARIVYVVDEPSRFGFAYGTLPSHVEKGEERFQVLHDPADGAVWYDILAFSRPQQLLTKIGYPLVRRLQKRFGRDSAAAMLRAMTVDGTYLT